jgi:hypothetical protein
MHEAQFRTVGKGRGWCDGDGLSEALATFGEGLRGIVLLAFLH